MSLQQRILVVVPTTNGPLLLRSLKPRPGLPVSAAFADGDYRPLPWSGDYARLSAPDGPLARLAGDALPPHELRLSGCFDAGRSWETPICLAHGLATQGHLLAAELAQADLILWATGAVDLDLAVIPGDYALLDKIERSRTLLADAPRAALAVLLPEGPERAEAEAVIRALGREIPPLVLPPTSVGAALHALAQPAGSAAARPPARQRLFALPLVAAGIVSAVAALAFGVARLPSTAAPDHPVKDAAGSPAKTAKMDADEAQPKPPETPSPPRVQVEELRAPAGSSCRRVAFGADQPERRAVALVSDGRLAATRLTPDLCGLAICAEAPRGTLEIGQELRAASLPPVRLPDGAQAYFLKEAARQNFVYAVQVIPGAGPPGPRLVHALTR
ncbi:hypothetical protein HCU64_20355 [Methylobacterium sp. C25]|uniref:hypothetical protein n=1 Tax=Methylobacterium sp. C25 TaxID=2721622 RepID=UPI001F3A3294|nr:hypothetical protein [Methylobacterium sp. C25]MCE4226107.1 hypothetical protein [Methylobacterium sp. C25]